VVGFSGDASQLFEVGAPVTIEVRPVGCFSSSCTVVKTAFCSLSGEGTDLQVEALICLADIGGGPGQPCTDDCGGGGVASTTFTPTEAGTYTFSLGELSVSVEIPSIVTAWNGVCVGEIF
jgi:hypothetical protein